MAPVVYITRIILAVGGEHLQRSIGRKEETREIGSSWVGRWRSNAIDKGTTLLGLNHAIFSVHTTNAGQESIDGPIGGIKCDILQYTHKRILQGIQ